MGGETSRLPRSWVVLLIAVPWTLGLMWELHSVWLHYRLLKEGIHSTAIIIAKEPYNHRSVRYEYKAGDRVFVGLESYDDFDRVEIGDSVSAHYLPSRPSVSRLGNPQKNFEESYGTIPVLVLAILVVVFIASKSSIPRSNATTGSGHQGPTWK